MSYPDRRFRGHRDNQDDGGSRFRQPRQEHGFPSDDGGGIPSQATVKWYNQEKGFGFVTLDDGSDCFLHASALTRAGVAVNEGDVVRVRIGQGPRGRQVSEVVEVQPGTGQQRRAPGPDAGGGYGAPGGSRPPRAGGGGRPGAPSGPTVETQGTVKWWNATKGFGFITPVDGSKDIFIHVSTLSRCGIQQLNEGQSVSLRVSQGPKGPEAVEISAS